MNKRYVFILVLVLVMTFSSTVIAAQPSIFADVPPKHWAYDAINQLAKDGIIDGYGDGYFRGDRTITRYEMAVIVGNAMTKANKADAQQKALIEKLASEFNSELARLDARVDKVEAKQKLNFSMNTRFQFTHTSLGPNDGGGLVGNANIDQKSQFSERVRINFNQKINEVWQWDARIHQDNFNFHQGNYDDNAQIDLFYVTGNVLGGKVELGRNILYPGKGGFINRDFKADGLNYSVYNTDKSLWFRAGTGRSTNPPFDVTKNRTSSYNYAEFIFKPTKTSDIGAYYYQQDGWNFPLNNSGAEDLKVVSVNAAFQIPNSKLAISGEWARNEADSPGVKGKSGYWIALNSNYGFTYWNPALVTMVDPTQTGAQAWGLSYRHMPSGVAGAHNYNAYATWCPWATDKQGNLMNAIDNVNAVRFDYQWVPWKNVVLMAGYDRIKPINAAAAKTNSVFYCALDFIY